MTDPIREALGLLRSVIWSGEPWTDQCETAFMGALADVAALRADNTRLAKDAEWAAKKAERLREFIDYTVDAYGNRMPTQWHAHARAALGEGAGTG